MVEDSEAVYGALLRITATAFPVMGFYQELEERSKAAGRELPPNIRAVFEPFGAALAQAVLLLPEDELRETVLGLIPEDAPEQHQVAANNLDHLFRKLRQASSQPEEAA